MNERVTEDIVREHLKASFEQGVNGEYWEQTSTNSRITHLLRHASKQGDGPGRPEFIVSLYDRPEFLIVIECKPGLQQHESADGLSNPRDFAVDGVRHYARFLSEEFNVLAIAVSGTSRDLIRVSHFLHFKGEPASEAAPAFGNSLLPVKDYITGYTGHNKVLNQDLGSLLLFTKELNGRLHTLKIKEGQRSLLISAILMALKDPAFASAYQLSSSPRLLMNSIKETMIESMRQAGLRNETLQTIVTSYAFTETPGQLEQGTVLVDLVSEIDRKINSFQETHEYYDFLGQLYIEFLRYSNNDKGLGIVLTPPHITELAARLVRVGKDDVLYDNCAGTGGFLIAGMKSMISQAGQDSALLDDIKTRVIGCEIQSDIASLLCSNMFIHGDGKSKVIYGDCFAHLGEVKNQKPTVGFLNPPFKAQTSDTEELLFVLNNLDALEPGGRCAAVLPMQWALVNRGPRQALKQQLLERHTLDGVLSLPNELFHDSKVGTVVCLMLFTAHRPHPAGQQTWFGYCKDDGFQTRKPQGRADYLNRWERISERWENAFHNRMVQPGFSVMQRVSAADEWCAEAFIETDYADYQARCIQGVKDYVAHQVVNSIMGGDAAIAVALHPVAEPSPLPPVSQWQSVKIGDLFKVTGSKTTPLEDLQQIHGPGEYPYVTTQAVNNGVAGHYAHWTEKGGVITVDSAVMGYASYQSSPFSASDHVEVLTPKFAMTPHMAMFFVALLNADQFRYNYGRKASQTRIKARSIKVPANQTGDIDYAGIESFINGLPHSSGIAAA